MAKNSSDNEAKSMWEVQVETGPNHAIAVNGKELIGLEEFLQTLAREKKLNWWELATVLSYIAAGQIAAADFEVKGTEASMRFLNNLPQMLAVHIAALSSGDNIAINPSEQSIN